MAFLTLRITPCLLLVVSLFLLGNQLNHVIELFNHFIKRVPNLQRHSNFGKLQGLRALCHASKLFLDLFPHRESVPRSTHLKQRRTGTSLCSCLDSSKCLKSLITVQNGDSLCNSSLLICPNHLA